MLMVVLIVMLCAVPVFADTTGGGTGHCVQTSILGDGNEVCDDGTGSSVWDILRLITDIMSRSVLSQNAATHFKIITRVSMSPMASEFSSFFMSH